MTCATNPLEQALWVKEETTPGTWVAPATGDSIMVNGDIEFMQENPPSENNEKNLTRLRNHPHKQVKAAGTFTIPAYIKSSGTAGTAPSVGPLLKGLYGSEVIDPGVSVTYKIAEPTNCAITHSVIARNDDKYYYIRGLKVLTGPIALQVGQDDAAILQTQFGGIFMDKAWAGESTLSAAASISDTTIEVDHKNFSVGSYIVVGTDDNGGAGFEVTAVDETTGDLTITPAITVGQNLGDPVTPWAPAFTEPVEVALHGQYGQATVNKAGEGVVNLDIRAGNINVEDTISFVHEKNGLDYPTGIRAGEFRTISGDVTYTETKTTGDDMMRTQQWHQTYAWVLPWQSQVAYVAGERCTITLPSTQPVMPSHSNTDAGIESTVTFTGHDDAADYDAIELKFD